MMIAQPNNDTKDTDDGCDNGKHNLHYVNNKGYQRAAYTETTCIIAAEEECKGKKVFINAKVISAMEQICFPFFKSSYCNLLFKSL